MTTSPELNAAELAAGTAALKTMIGKLIPSWEQGMIPAGMVEQAVTAIVSAVDAVRDAAKT